MGEQTLDLYLSVIVFALLWAEMPLFQQPKVNNGMEKSCMYETLQLIHGTRWFTSQFP
jgi:hypothetical protein